MEATTKIDKKRCIEFGQMCAAFMLLLFFYGHQKIFVSISLVILAINLINPLIFYPFAVAWFWLGNKLSYISSVTVLSIIFFVVVVPVGLVRRLIEKDALALKKFKKDSKSVLISRNHLYTREDLINSF